MDRDAIVDLLKDWGLAAAITVAVLAGWQLLSPVGARLLGVGPVEGDAPTLVAAHVDGTPFDLADVEAEAIVVNFWATWCGPCKREIPEFAAFADAHPEVPVYGVSVDTLPPARLAQDARRLGVTYPVLHDPQSAAAHTWGVTSFPTTFVLDAHHDIVAVRVGTLDQSRLEKLVDAARAGHAP